MQALTVADIGQHVSFDPLCPIDPQSRSILSHEAQIHLQSLSKSLADKTQDRNSSRSSKASKKSPHSSTGASSGRSRQSKKKTKAAIKAANKAENKAAPVVLPIDSKVHFAPMPSSNEVWNRMFVGSTMRLGEVANKVEPDLSKKKQQQLRQLSKMEKRRQSKEHSANSQMQPEEKQLGMLYMGTSTKQGQSDHNSFWPASYKPAVMAPIDSPSDSKAHTESPSDSQSDFDHASSDAQEVPRSRRQSTSSDTDGQSASQSNVNHIFSQPHVNLNGSQTISDCKSMSGAEKIPFSRRLSSSDKKAQAPRPNQSEHVIHQVGITESSCCLTGALKLIERAFGVRFTTESQCAQAAQRNSNPMNDLQRRTKVQAALDKSCETWLPMSSHPISRRHDKERITAKASSRPSQTETAAVPVISKMTTPKTYELSVQTRRSSSKDLPSLSTRCSKDSRSGGSGCKTSSGAESVSGNEFDESWLAHLPADLPSLPDELVTQVEAAGLENASLPALLAALPQLAGDTKSPKIVPVLLQLVILCERTPCVSAFKRFGAKDILLRIAQEKYYLSVDPILIKMMVGAVFALLSRQPGGARLLFTGDAREDKHIVLLLLQCIVDLETCSQMTQAVAPRCLTAIFTCLLAMMLNGNSLALQFLTKGTIRRFVKLLEAAEDFMSSRAVTQIQLSVFLTAGLEWLAIAAKNSSDTRKLLMKENAVYRTLNILAREADNCAQYEVAALKRLVGSLCSWSEECTCQLFAWISENADNPDVAPLAVEVCMSSISILDRIASARPPRRQSPMGSVDQLYMGRRASESFRLGC